MKLLLIVATYSCCLLIEPQIFRLNGIVIPKILDHWKDVAYYSLCYDVSLVAEIEERCAGDPKQCCSDLFKDWLNTKNGTSPKTWDTLLKQLKEVEGLTNKVGEIMQELS